LLLSSHNFFVKSNAFKAVIWAFNGLNGTFLALAEGSKKHIRLLSIGTSLRTLLKERDIKFVLQLGLTEKRLSLLKLNIYIKEVVKKCKGS
jgi:hypothetical protein